MTAPSTRIDPSHEDPHRLRGHSLPPMPPYSFTRPARRTGPILGLALVWAWLLALRIGLEASFWILTPLALLTLPSLYEVITNPIARLTLDDTSVTWRAGRRRGEIDRARLAGVRFDTGWDMITRVTFQLTDGQSLRLPPDCAPPPRSFQAALVERDVSITRHHFGAGHRS